MEPKRHNRVREFIGALADVCNQANSLQKVFEAMQAASGDPKQEHLDLQNLVSFMVPAASAEEVHVLGLLLDGRMATWPDGNISKKEFEAGVITCTQVISLMTIQATPLQTYGD